MYHDEFNNVNFILPASMLTRQESEILWYEVTVYDKENRCHIDAFHGRSKEKISEADAQLSGGNRVKTVITGNSATLTAEIAAEKKNDGNSDIQFMLNGQRVDILQLTHQPETAIKDINVKLSETEIKLALQWGRLGESLGTMAEVMGAKLTTFNMSCASCVLVGIGADIQAAGCIAGAVSGSVPLVLVSCPTAGFLGTLFVAQCPGACA